MINKLEFTTRGKNHEDLDEAAWAIAETYYGVGGTYSILWSSNARYVEDYRSPDYSISETPGIFEAEFIFVEGEI